MNLEVFFHELLTRINELASQDSKHHRSFGFQSNGTYNQIIKDIQVLIRNYRYPHPSDKEFNRQVWQSIIKKDQDQNLGLFNAYQGNVSLRSSMKRFLDEGPPVRMTRTT